jgi:hypothetical protein
MMTENSSENVFVVGDHVVLVAVDDQDAPTSLEVTLYLDGQRVRSFEEVGWRVPRYGVADLTFYWWSARRVVSVRLDAPTEVDLVEADEDIILVFRRPRGWLLVCETSLRLVLGGQEVVELARFRGHFSIRTRPHQR